MFSYNYLYLSLFVYCVYDILMFFFWQHQWRYMCFVDLKVAIKHFSFYAYIIKVNSSDPNFNPTRHGPFYSQMGWRAKNTFLLPKFCHTYPTMMKLDSYTLPKEDPKNIWITWHITKFLLASAFFHRRSVNFAISRNTYIDCILKHNF